MKTLNLIFTSIILFSTSNVIAQTVSNEQIWVTIENPDNVPYFDNGKLVSKSIEIQNTIDNFNINAVSQALSNSKNLDLQKVYQFDCNCNAEKLITELITNSSELSSPELAPRYELLSEPNDLLLEFPTDYALDLINAEQAWDYSTGDSTQVLGISDGNFFIDHEDINDSYVYYDSMNTSPYYTHGTAVATTAAGTTNNGVGKSAIGYDCKLSLVGMNYNSILELSYSGIKVINVSWMSSCTPSNYVQNVMNEVYQNGTIIVAAAGNGSCNGAANLVYPAACDNVIAVSSVGPTNNHEGVIGDSMSCHQHNSSVDLCAPGYLVALTTNPGVYTFGNGSSFAAPYVTGTIGLIQSLRPCLSPSEIEDIILSTAHNIDSLNPNYAGLLGAGTLDAGAALEKAFFEYSCTVIEDSTEINQSITESEVNGSLAGLEGIEMDQIMLYPNPTNGMVTLKLGEHENIDLIVTDTKGRLVESLNISNEIESVDFNVENQGFYFVQLIQSGQPIWTQRLVRL